MNMTIYFLTKKIIISDSAQPTQNQLIIDTKSFKKNDLFNEFKKFINQNDVQTLVFLSNNTEKVFAEFKKSFKVIYAAGGLITQNNKFLFIFRLKKWDLPKGKLDMGESPEEAAIRECEEECGITKLTITSELDSTFHIYEHKGGYAIKKTYWYNMSTLHDKALVPQTEESIEQVEWFDEKQIKELVLSNTYPAILDVIKHIDLTKVTSAIN